MGTGSFRVAVSSRPLYRRCKETFILTTPISARCQRYSRSQIHSEDLLIIVFLMRGAQLESHIHAFSHAFECWAMPEQSDAQALLQTNTAGASRRAAVLSEERFE